MPKLLVGAAAGVLSIAIIFSAMVLWQANGCGLDYGVHATMLGLSLLLWPIALVISMIPVGLALVFGARVVLFELAIAVLCAILLFGQYSAEQSARNTAQACVLNAP